MEVVDQSTNMSASSMIFPVLNYDQQSVSISNDTSVPVSSIPTTLASSEIERLQNEDDDPFRDPVSPISLTSSLTALKCNRKLESRFEIESQSDLYDSDEESDDDSSIASSTDVSQDFIVVERDLDDDTQMQRERGVQPYILNNLNENTQPEVKSLIENVQNSSSVDDELHATDESKPSEVIPEKYHEELTHLAEMV